MKDCEFDSDGDYRVVGSDAGFDVNCGVLLRGDLDLSVGVGDYVVGWGVGERWWEGLSVAEVALG